MGISELEQHGLSIYLSTLNCLELMKSECSHGISLLQSFVMKVLTVLTLSGATLIRFQESLWLPEKPSAIFVIFPSKSMFWKNFCNFIDIVHLKSFSSHSEQNLGVSLITCGFI